MISYCTEKTTEYSLVPAFSSLLSDCGENVPIQYWKTREGNKTSSALHGSEQVYLVAFFARRPKVKITKDGLLQGKINSDIFEFNSMAKKSGVPVFCGMPLARNLFEIYNSENVWFYVPPNAPDYDEVIFNLTDCNDVVISDPNSVVEQVLSGNVAEIVRQQCSPMTWVQAVDIMTELNRKPGNSAWFLRSWRHKPVYFVIKQKP
ncbi:hypothetical protein MACH09_06100 [Vibrio sp. MACH09]|uniref:hypothetical protein n=1 Tax=Vibrio sp. MACH09 TaxID=3025122 RepID=UPI002791F5E8|nr:hypothetical protein [Vibrio sp. MACH09]GLO60102.1 hypothetical protein MACH09_06100 [Vibrio sp. MACH09]